MSGGLLKSTVDCDSGVKEPNVVSFQSKPQAKICSLATSR
jgi:hypothetical protein